MALKRFQNNLLFYTKVVREDMALITALWPEPVNLAGNQMQNLISAAVARFLEATA